MGQRQWFRLQMRRTSLDLLEDRPVVAKSKELATAPHWAEDLDSGLLGQVRAELRGYFRPPFDVPTIVVINISLALGIWFFINPGDVIRFTSLAFLPIGLVAWAFADVPSTNLFGATAPYAVQHMDEPAKLRRMMTVKNLALWVLVSPACFLLSLALMPGIGTPLLSLAVGVAVMALPFAYLGLAAVIAPLLPFHPMPWRERLHRRDTWLRYGLAVAIAYFALTGPAALLALAPAFLVLAFVGQEPVHLLLGAILITPWTFFLWRLGIHYGVKIALRRRTWLEEFLGDPSRG